MKKKIKAWGLLVLAALLAFALSGCDIPMPGFADYDVSGYIQALLDSSYHNSHDSFIVVAQTTEEAARESHATTIENMVINFCNTYGVNPSEEQLSQLTEIFSQLLQHAKYTVREEQKVDTGYYIEVEVTPIVNFSDCSAQLEALEEADALNTPSPSPEPEEDEDGDGGEDDWGEEERENDEEESPIATPKPVTTQVNPQELYMEKVVEFCRQQAAAIDYGVARTMSLQLDLNQIENIDQTILQLTAG